MSTIILTIYKNMLTIWQRANRFGTDMIVNHFEICRRQKGKSLGQIARDVGVDKSHISKIASGKRLPGLGLALKLAVCLNCKIEEIFFIIND
jgi:DNA-binding XRE family transcriptional regulator